MTHLICCRVFRHSLMGTFAILVTLAVAIRANAAVAEGPKSTNAAVAEERRFLQFNEAERSYQEKLRVGRERYDQKQIDRAKVIKAMSAELEARQRTVVIHPVGAPDDNPDQTISRSLPSPAAVLLAVSLMGVGYYLKRLNLISPEPPFRHKESGFVGSRPLRKRYRVTALKPVIIWANVEVLRMERNLLGARVRSTEDKSAWIELKAGEMRDKVGLVLGIHPDCVPHGRRVSLTDADSDIVPLGAWTDGDLPRNFFEFFILEVSE